MEIDTNLFDDGLSGIEIPADVKSETVIQVRADMRPVLEAARAMTVTDEPSYEQAMKLAAECARRSKKVETEFSEAREKTHAAWKAVTTLIASFTKPLDEARKLLDGKAGKWHREEVERRRVEAEKKRREEEKAREEEKLRLAEKLAAVGETAAADAVLEEDTYVAPVAVEEPHVEGSTHIPKWTFQVTDIMALIKAVAAGTENASLLSVNTTMLGQMARSQKNAAKVTGVRFFDSGTVRHTS
jgi:hypothetical protein